MFDAATRTAAIHFSRVDQGYLLYYFYLKTFKNKKRFQNTDCEANLDPFFQKKNIANFCKNVESSIFI